MFSGNIHPYFETVILPGTILQGSQRPGVSSSLFTNWYLQSCISSIILEALTPDFRNISSSSFLEIFIFSIKNFMDLFSDEVIAKGFFFEMLFMVMD